jgi:hypothetical protein
VDTEQTARPSARTTLLLLVLAVALVGNATHDAAIQPPHTANPVGDALCGRASASRPLAAALDGFSPKAPPAQWIWAAQSIDTWRAWTQAAECTDASPDERQRYDTRMAVLTRLEPILVRGAVVATIKAQVLALPSMAYREEEWPPSCRPCEELRALTDLLRSAAPEPRPEHRQQRRPEPNVTTIGLRLQQAAQYDALASTLCPLRPRAAALLADVRSRFAYFTWTRTGVAVLDAASILQYPPLDELCR